MAIASLLAGFVLVVAACAPAPAPTTTTLPTTTTTLLAGSDSAAPVVQSVSVSPSQIDTSTSAATVNVTARITDDLSGVYAGSVNFVGPTGQVISANYDASRRISGTPLDGTYHATITIPRYSAQGTWTIAYMNALDNALNRRNFDATEALAEVGPVTFSNATP